MNRRFGVEIECGHPNSYAPTECVRKHLSADEIPFDSIGTDARGVEVRTRPLLGEPGFAELKLVMDKLVGIGCFVKSIDGQHIHLEAKDFAGRDNRDHCIRLVESYVNNREHILQFIAPYRRNNYSMCANGWGGEHVQHDPSYEGETLEKLKDGVWYGAKGYDLNLARLKRADGTQKTIEIRLHEGNLDYSKAHAWIEFWMGFLDSVKNHKRPLRKYKNTDTMFAMLDLNPVHRKRLYEAAEKYSKK